MNPTMFQFPFSADMLNLMSNARATNPFIAFGMPQAGGFGGGTPVQAGVTKAPKVPGAPLNNTSPGRGTFRQTVRPNLGGGMAINNPFLRFAFGGQ